MHTVFLSKRNLLALLSKLDRKQAGEQTECTIIKYQQSCIEYQQTMVQITVTAVPDELYYTALSRLPGQMIEADEQHLPVFSDNIN